MPNIFSKGNIKDFLEESWILKYCFLVRMFGFLSRLKTPAYVARFLNQLTGYTYRKFDSGAHWFNMRLSLGRYS